MDHSGGDPTKVAVIADAFGWDAVPKLGECEQFFYSPTHGDFPNGAALAQLDVIVVVCPLKSASVASQLGGSIGIALERSQPTLVIAFEMHFGEPDKALLGRLGHPIPFGNVPNAVFDSASEFADYFTEFGLGGDAFYQSQVERATVLGWIDENSGPRAPAALCWESAHYGVTYTIPYHISRPDQAAPMLASLYRAVRRHRSALAIGLPGYLSDVRLGVTETALLKEIESGEAALREKRAEAEALAKWRHLIGRTSGSPFVHLVVDALNVILEGTGYVAEVRAETGAEDFWIVGSGGDLALGEAKGVGGGIARANVSQVDSHREANQLGPEFPGILIVNVFRNETEIGRKQTGQVAPNVVQLATQQKVLVVQAWDLYQLVGRKLDGFDAGEELVGALSTGGGWLRVADDSVAVAQ